MTLWSGDLCDSNLISEDSIVKAADKFLTPQTVVIGHLNHPPVTHVYGHFVDLIRDRKLRSVTLKVHPPRHGRQDRRGVIDCKLSTRLEEALESLASRVRPLILNSEPIYNRKSSTLLRSWSELTSSTRRSTWPGGTATGVRSSTPTSTFRRIG
jgi:hypothetical protein